MGAAKAIPLRKRKTERATRSKSMSDDWPSCDSKDCDQLAHYRYFWPGKPPGYKCVICMHKALHIADAMGFHLHMEEYVHPRP